MRQILLQNATAILLQNATEVYYKMCQDETVLLQNATVITKCDVYYKLRQYIEFEYFLSYFANYWLIAKILIIFGNCSSRSTSW